MSERNYICKKKNVESYWKRHSNQLCKSSDFISKDIIIENEQIEPKIVDEFPSVPFPLENSDYNSLIKINHSYIKKEEQLRKCNGKASRSNHA